MTFVTQSPRKPAAPPTVLEVNEQTFQAEVIDRSQSVPVVIDFWAPWCGPCRTLGPTLEKLAKEANGAWVLAKVNVDENPRLAQAFRVQGIPAVKAVSGGQMIAEFTGALPESQVRAWLKQLAPAPAEDPIAAMAELEARDPQEAAARYRVLLGDEPQNDEVLFRLGRLLVMQGDAEGAAVLRDVSAGSPLFSRAQSLMELATFFASAADTSAAVLKERSARDARDTESRYLLAALDARAGRHAAALDALLDIVQRDRAFREDAGRKTMLGLFAALGDEEPLVSAYRRKLANALF